MKKYDKIIVEEICRECNFVERIIVKLLRQVFIKTYKLGITFGYNNK